MRSVIVGLDIPYKLESELAESQVRQQRANISRAQEELIKVIPGEFEVVTKFWLMPSMTLNVDEEALKFLQESPLVKSIEENELMKLPKVIRGKQ